MTSAQVFTGLLGEIGGVGGGSGHPLIHFVLGFVLWSFMLVIARKWRASQIGAAASLLTVGAALALVRETLMIGVKVLEASGAVQSVSLHAVFPPMEHALLGVVIVLILGSFATWREPDMSGIRRVVGAGVVASLLCYAVTCIWWADYILSEPDSKFGQTWCDWLFHANGTLWSLLAIVVLWTRFEGWMRRTVCAGFACFFIYEGLKIPDLALGEAYEYVFAPIRHIAILAGPPILGYALVRGQITSAPPGRAQIEERVSERFDELHKLIRRLSRSNEQLAHMTTLDPLTGLHNRRSFEDQLDREWLRGRERATALAIILLDLDHFKEINDLHGHQAGDYCLEKVGEHLRSSTEGAGCFAARYGGEEFALILSNRSSVEAAAFGEALRQLIQAIDLETATGRLSLTASVGAATEIPSQNCTAKDLVSHADRALYHAKYSGRNQTWLFDTPEGKFRRLSGKIESTARPLNIELDPVPKSKP